MTTKSLRDILKEILFKEYENIGPLLESLDSKDRIDAVIKLSKYVLPSMENVQITMDSDDNESIYLK